MNRARLDFQACACSWPARALAVLLVGFLFAGCVDESAGTGGDTPTDSLALAELGRVLFADRALSSGGNQSCADCHARPSAFADPDEVPVSEGSVAGRFGTRNTPTAMYAASIPPLALRNTAGGQRWTGGLFLDGRADTLELQARAPLFNPLEMNLVDAADLMEKLRDSDSASAYRAFYGSDSLDAGVAADGVVTRVAAAMAAFERTTELQPFSSKFDAVAAGRAQFTAQEALGRDVFQRPDKGDCAACHAVAPAPGESRTTFSNHAYENIGVPRNPDRRFFADDFIDSGLEASLLGRGVSAEDAAAQRGKFRVPTLRNVALTAPYMHNGVFADLKTVVEFYNTRDTDVARWQAIGEMEVRETVERTHTGNPGLTTAEVDALVAFLNTLSDGFVP